MKSLYFVILGVGTAVATAGPLRAQNFSANMISIERPWSRESPSGASSAVVYMTIINQGTDADRLLGATTPIGRNVQFHSSTNDNGVMRMRELSQIEIKPGATFVLQPNSNHAMIMGLKQPPKEGGSFPLTLHFQKSGNIKVIVPVAKVGALEAPHRDGM